MLRLFPRNSQSQSTEGARRNDSSGQSRSKRRKLAFGQTFEGRDGFSLEDRDLLSTIQSTSGD